VSHRRRHADDGMRTLLALVVGVFLTALVALATGAFLVAVEVELFTLVDAFFKG
jgi:hypothetical protein